jgi:hypothetical protein
LTPEVDLASAKRYAPSAKLTGARTDPRVEERAAFGAVDDERILRTSLTVTDPGYYRVLIAARAPTDPAMQDSHLVQDVVYDEVWFSVTADGGRVTQDYDAGVFPEGAFQQPGPFRPLDLATAAAASSTSARMLDPMTLQMSYYNNDSSRYEPLGDAKYRLVVSPGNITYTGQTNANGEFTYPCATAGGSTGTLDVWYESAGKASVIRPAALGTLALHAGVPVTICGGAVSAAVDPSSDGNYTARVFTNAVITVNTSRTYFPTRPAISFRFSTISPDTYYSPNDDQIHIDWMATWGAYGIFSAAHEYGHALHHIVLGGIKTDSGTCGTTHLYDAYINYGCAYYEGFGDYHAAVVRGAAGGFLDSAVVSGRNHGGQNGAINEIGVASFLYDLTDSAGDEAFDSVQYPTSYIADVWRTCNTHFAPFPSGWQRASAIDHMIYCFEQTVDPVATAYFRGALFDGEAELATEPSGWSQSAIRSIWKADLFNQ